MTGNKATLLPQISFQKNGPYSRVNTKQKSIKGSKGSCGFSGSHEQ